jgi:hypothetical protein
MLTAHRHLHSVRPFRSGQLVLLSRRLPALATHSADVLLLPCRLLVQMAAAGSAVLQVGRLRWGQHTPHSSLPAARIAANGLRRRSVASLAVTGVLSGGGSLPGQHHAAPAHGRHPPGATPSLPHSSGLQTDVTRACREACICRAALGGCLAAGFHAAGCLRVC